MPRRPLILCVDDEFNGLEGRKMLLDGKRQSRKHKLDERGILLTTDAERPRQLG